MGEAPREMRNGPKEPAGELRLNGRQLRKFIMAFGTEILSVDAVPMEDDPAHLRCLLRPQSLG